VGDSTLNEGLETIGLGEVSSLLIIELENEGIPLNLPAGHQLLIQVHI
jgi:hypothetical protein